MDPEIFNQNYTNNKSDDFIIFFSIVIINVKYFK